MTEDDEQKRRNQQIGRAVQTLRGEQSQQALAEKMKTRGHKWSQSTVWSVERGDRAVRLAEAEDLAEVLDVEVGALLADHEDVEQERWLMAAVRKMDSARRRLEDATVDYEFWRSVVLRKLERVKLGLVMPEDARGMLETSAGTTTEAVIHGDLTGAEERARVRRQGMDVVEAESDTARRFTYMG